MKAQKKRKEIRRTSIYRRGSGENEKAKGIVAIP
jgi:hypothetical protein